MNKTPSSFILHPFWDRLQLKNQVSSGEPVPPSSMWRIPLVANPGADRNLLFGVLALQMDFITKEVLVQAMNAWVLNKTIPLGQILLHLGALSEDTYAL